MPDMFSERAVNSPDRWAIKRVLDEFKSASDDQGVEALKIYHRARDLLGTVDQAYEVGSRIRKMVLQIRSGSWPEDSLRAVGSAASKTGESLIWIREDNPLSAGLNLVRKLVERGVLSEDMKTVEAAEQYLRRVETAISCFNNIEALVSESEQVDQVLTDVEKEAKEICRALL